MVKKNLQPQQKKADVAHQLFLELKELLGVQVGLFLDIGKRLKRVRDEMFYKELGYEGFVEFLGDPEIGIGQATAYAYVLIYETFVVHYGLNEASLKEVPWSKLRAILPVIKNKELAEVEEWLAKAKSLSQSDLIDEVKDSKDYEKDPEAVKRPLLFRCSKCKRWKVVGDDNQMCRC